MQNREKTKDELIEELVAVRQQLAQVEQAKFPQMRSPISSNKINVSGCDIEWQVERGTFTIAEVPGILMWLDTTLAGLMSGFQAMVSTERFGLALQREGRKSVETDWHVISQFDTFEEGFATLATMARAAGWGKMQLIDLDWEKQLCCFRVADSWEGRYQKALGVCWGSGMMAGKFAGFCTKLFDTNCWSEQTSFIARGDQFDEFVVRSSDRTLEEELDRLLVTDSATRTDMAVALEQLRQEITRREKIEAEREQLLHQLEIERSRFEAVLRQMPAGVIIADGVTGKTILANQQVEAILGYPAISEIERYGEYTGIHEDGTPLSKEEYPIVRSLTTGETIAKEEVEFIRPDGSRGVVEISSAPIYDQAKIAAAVAIFNDISEAKRAREELRRSEAKFRRLVDSNIIGVILATIDGAITDANDAFLKTIGYTRQEVLGGQVRWDEITPPELRHLDVLALEELIAKGTHTPYEKVYIAKDGRRVPILVGAALLEDRSRQNAISFILDLTQRKQAEEAVRENAERLNLALAVSCLGDWSWDAATDIVTFSDRAGEIFGIPSGPYMTWTRMGKLLDPEDRERVCLAVEKAIAERIDYDIEYRVIAPNGKKKWISAKGRAQYNANGQVLRMLGVVQDVTDRKLAEEERERLLALEQAARTEAETANRIKDEFLAVLSHELRSPLNPILGWTNLLRTRQLDRNTTEKALETIERNARLQVQLIEDLLDVSRILRRKMVLNVAQVNLVTTIEAALETVQLAAEAKGVQIQTLLDWNVGQISGDASRLQQVFWNLLSNAIKFTPAGGRVEVCLKSINSYAEIQIKDTGMGISSEFIPYVFDYFRQADGGTTRQFGGLGLGLAIVRQLTELHGGTVEAQSLGEGMGATFTIKLPLSETMAETNQDRKLFVTSENLTGCQILMVDDDVDMRELATIILSQYGANVKVAASGMEALLILDQFHPDILISDIGMPQMDGYMLMRQVRSRLPAEGGLVPAIALTAYAAEYDRDQALAAGFQKHIAKPVDPTELISAIFSLLNQ